MNVVRVKYAMRRYARDHELEIPRGFSPIVPVWGEGARKLAYRITTHAATKHGKKIEPSAQNTAALRALLFPDAIPALRIIRHDWTWAHALVKRIGTPPGIVWHHAAARVYSPEQVHASHKANGWAGIGYHFYIRKNGEVHAGRPLWAMGAHCLGHNDWIGVCFEGAYHLEETMPAAQLAAGRAVHKYLHEKYGGIPDRRHGAMPGNSTACPGKFFPFAKITGAA